MAEACVEDAFWLPHRVLMSDEETLSGNRGHHPFPAVAFLTIKHTLKRRF